ncbi:LysM peptidoglycan-binding domain-containing protein [Janibacter indicus]|uniref:LysM peptidoglycan-binding domain-containing protein n=1 Tax=Janibacter indicus TaxID=857417 RepID=A0A7L9J540_9MICO|nr:LysM peptidoglycan-binding domain-containing protein [Janibacter indicus]QOK24173.1 LysM peptidoglycan-binding domain-containing protein [Janibacter indicus]
MTRAANFVKGLLALATILLLIVGAPALLLLSGVLPDQLPTLDQITSALTSRDETGQVLIAVLVIAAAVLWAAFTYSVLVEAIAAARGIRLSVPKGPAGRPAAALVGAVIAMGASTMTATAAPAAQPLVAAQESTASVTASPEESQTEAESAPSRQASTREVTVQRHETLWSISDRELGDPMRYREIAALNGLSQPYTITPGQQLLLPGHAPSAVTVEPGDTLAEIAAENDTTWMALAEANPQITNPDLIHVGDTIAVPTVQPQGTTEGTQAEEATEALEDASETGLSAAEQEAPAAGGEDREPQAPETAAPVVPETVPNESPSAAAPAQPQAEGDEATADVPLAEIAGIAAFAGGGAVLAAGTLTLLRRRRTAQRRHRRPGRAAPTPATELVPIERGVRSAGTGVLATLESMDQALRSLAATCASQQRPFPPVAAVELDGPEVVIHLSAPADLPAPWAGEGTRWVYDGTDLDESVHDGEAPIPALVTVGTGPQGEVWLLNLEELGAVTITGDADKSADLIRYMAAELAVNDWSQTVRMDLVDVATEIAAIDPGRIHVHDQAERAAQDLTAHAVSTIDRTGEAGTTVADARANQTGEDLWTSSALLVARNDDPAVVQAAHTVATSVGRAGASVVSLSQHDPQDDLITVIDVSADGHLFMPRTGLRLTACALPTDEAHGIVQLLDQGRAQHDEPMPLAASGGEDEDWRSMTDTAGALREEFTQPRDEHGDDETSSSVLPPDEDEWIAQTATTVEDVERIAPRVTESVRADLEARDPDLDADLERWHSQDCDLPRLSLLGPVTARVGGDARAVLEDSRAYLTELLAYLALRPQGATMAEVREAFGVSDGRVRSSIKSLRDWLGTNPRTDKPHLPNAKDSRASKIRGVGVYQVDDVLVDVDLFRRLRARGQARGEHGIEDLKAALTLVEGPPFEHLRPGGWSWLAEGDRPDQQMVCAVTDVAHIVINHAIATNDGPTALATAEAVMAAVPHEEIARLDLVAAMSAAGHGNSAAKLRQSVLESSDEALPVDLSERTDRIVRDREWAKEAS